VLARGASLALFVALWWLIAQKAGSATLPGPLAVLRVAASDTLSGEMPRQIGITLLRVASAFLLAMALGTALGYAAGRSRRFDALLDPWLVIALNLPLLVVVLLVFIWLGLNEAAALLAIVIAKTPTVTVMLREGARALDPDLDEMAAVFRVPAPRRLRRLVLPQLAPYLAAAARAGLSVTWKIVLVVELLGRPNGVGFALNMAFQTFDVASILAYGLCFAALMLLVETLVLQPWERHARAWRRRA
jgi:NitT/TauT family transport system permease protein